MGKLGGWWRLWIVVSGLWVGIGVISAIIDRPASAEATFQDAKGGEIIVENVPLTISDDEMRQKVERHLKEEMKFAILELDRLEKKISDTEFKRRAAQIDFKPKPGWDKWNVGEPPVTVVSTPRGRMITWLTDTAAWTLSLPLGLLIAGLAFQWVRQGFRRQSAA